MAGQNYRSLLAWQKAMDLVEGVYRLTADFPADERFGLTSQLRRAAVSIPSNIAEGQGRTSRQEFLHFLSIAYGSLREVETQVMITSRLGLALSIDCERLLEASEQVGRLINGLASSLRRSI